MSYRFFGKVSNNIVSLASEDIFHLTKVLRINAKETIEVVSNDKLYVYVVTSTNPLTFSVSEEKALTNELPLDITLIYVLPKGDKLDLVLQKATELGARTIIITNSRFSIRKLKEAQLTKRLARFEKIIKSAAMQAKRDVLPTLKYVPKFNEALQLGRGHKLFAYENNAKHTLNDVLTQNITEISIVIGSEGGFHIDEVNMATTLGYELVTFGPLVFRTETAVIYALSVLNNYARGKNL